MNDSNINYPLVSIVTVNYKQSAVTLELLTSLEKITYPNVEVIVVDNETRGSCKNIKAKFPHIKLIASSSNLGFAGGNNLGLVACTGAYILFINNDIEVEPGFLEPLIAAFKLEKGILAVSPKIKYFHSKKIIQYAGGEKVHPITLRNGHRGSGKRDIGQFDTSQITAYAHGACMLVPKTTIEEIGTMNEEYFLYYEEQDWCERMLRAKGKVFYIADSVVYHKESISTGKKSPLKTYYLNRNRILFARKNYNGVTLILSLCYVGLVTTPKNTLQFLFNYPHLIAFYKALFWNFNHKTTFNY